MTRLLLAISLVLALASRIRNISLFDLANRFALILGWLVLGLITLAGGVKLVGGWSSRFKKPSLSLLKIKRKERVLFFTPHPDDETLAAGGLISQLLAQKNPLKIISVTRGNANPSLFFKDKKIKFSPEKFIETGRIREEEAKKAIKILGGQENNLLFWDYPDGVLSSLWKDPQKLIASQTTKLDHSPDTLQEYRGENLVKDIKSVIKKFQPTIIFIPHEEDDNSDHQAVSFFVKKALRACAWRGIVYQYPLHLKIFRLFRFYPPKNKILFPPARFGQKNYHWFSFWLSKEQLEKKKNALDSYQSQQIIPTLKALFKSFEAKNEIFALFDYSSKSSKR
ncbi:PIG-L family deacetylase [Candidatus Shapirobacteria bacterium]|nr:PIG-L family deacetylase [Candidatus Shapirobacteria bacterium]